MDQGEQGEEGREESQVAVMNGKAVRSLRETGCRSMAELLEKI